MYHEVLRALFFKVYELQPSILNYTKINVSLSVFFPYVICNKVDIENENAVMYMVEIN